MTVHFMGIGVSRLVAKNNPLQSSSPEYEAQNAKGVASIYTRLNDGDINLMGTCLDTNELMTKLRNQYADKGWGAESIAYRNLHKIMYEECEDMTDYVGKLRAAHVCLSSMGFTIDPKCLVYILMMGLPKEFDAWATAVWNASRTTREPPQFDSLTAQLLDESALKKDNEINAIAFVHRSKKQEANSKNKTGKPPNKCDHCGAMHKTEKCYSEHPELRPEGWKPKPGYVSLLKQKEQGDKRTYNLNEHGMNLMHFPLAMLQSSNTEDVMTFKAITEIPDKTLEQTNPSDIVRNTGNRE